MVVVVVLVIVVMEENKRCQSTDEKFRASNDINHAKPPLCLREMDIGLG